MTEQQQNTEKTIDLAELTRRCGEPEHRQQLIAAFADGLGPWTLTEAREISHAWTYTDAETGVYTDPERDQLI
jgi:hypothetical protein